ncbi:MFS transporter [Helicobacter canis]|uniref:Transmembrane transport protein n=1 Tax=Helicobacter canis TaxID=29419 RepID=A0A377J461_9HELI|nr:MFS transporter [Helicobacter canis]STO97220.1 Putative transmembrane transport protein [Helicobacter canis]
MTHTSTQKSSSKGIFALALSAFCMGVTEFIVAGILPDIATHFMISQPVAGWLVTIYAIGVVIGAPILTIPISRLDRKYQLMLNLSIFLLANLIVAISDHFYLTLCARFVAGCMHGVFFVIATIAAMKIAKEGKQNTALALMVSGLTIALVTGIPLGTFVGQLFGFQAIFWLIVVLTGVAIASVWLIMPNIQGQRTFIRNLFRALCVPKLLRAYIVTACTCGASFVLYTYIAEFLLVLSRFDKQSIASILLLYGGSAVVGNLLGGKITDIKGSIISLRLMLGAQIITYALMSISAYSQVFVLINLCVMGMVSFASIAPLKSLAVLLSHKYAKGFEDSAISVNEGSFNVGIASASALGGAIFAHLGIEFNALFAALFALPAFAIVLLMPRSL